MLEKTAIRTAVGACLVTAAAWGTTGQAAGRSAPVAVSPGLDSGIARVGACPTFSWAQVEGATGYELVLYRASEDDGVTEVGAEAVRRVRIPGQASSWTPSREECLESGDLYGWTVRAVGAAVVPGPGEAPETAWSEVNLFRVAGAPSAGEIEEAIEVLRRYLASKGEAASEGDRGGPPDAAEPDGRPQLPKAMAATLRPAGPEARSEGQRPEARSGGQRVARDPASEGLALATAAAPTLGSASLTLSDQIHLGTDSHHFKGGDLFLWDDGFGNLGLGRAALRSAKDSATSNTAVGLRALESTTVGISSVHGSENTGVGHFALRRNVSGYRNTASGAFALRDNTEGFRNTASGTRALAQNKTGDRNTAIGANALTSNTSGVRNTATGASALYRNTTGLRNTATGTEALRFNDTGHRNTATGHRALFWNVQGLWNTASGHRALYATTGSRNTATGVWALRDNTTGGSNTAVGVQTLFLSSTGSRNIALGYQAGSALGETDSPTTTMSHNIFIGNEGEADEERTIRLGTTPPTPSDAGQNRTFIAAIRDTTTDLGEAIGVVIDSAGQLGTVSSSREVKEDVRDVGELSERLLDLRPVAFRYRSHAAADPETPLEFGLIAEEVATAFPELVVRNEEGSPQTVKYRLLAVLLLNELQRHDEELREQRRLHRRHEELIGRLLAASSSSEAAEQ